LTALLGSRSVKVVKKALDRVETILGGYPGAVGALNLAPRPADYVTRLRPIARKAFDLLQMIEGSDTWTRDAVTLKIKALQRVRTSAPLIEPIEPEREPVSEPPRTVGDVSLALACLADACNAVIKENMGLPSKGAPKKAARDEVAKELCKVFAEHSRRWSRKRPRRGAFQQLSEYEANEREFIAAALADAKIPVPRNIRPRA
jgi:hypothetical protein